MKHKYCFSFLLLLGVLRLSAVPVTVSGQVTNADGTPAVEWPVFIGPLNPNGSGNLAVTDSTGFYSLVVDVPAADSAVEVLTYDDCTAQLVLAPIVNGAATANFILCSGTSNPNCWVYATAALQSGLAVQFSGQGYGMDSLAVFTYAWDFGDGAASTEQNPAHTYAATGTYTVTLTVSSANCSTTATLLVDVFPVQQVTVTGTVSDQNGLGVPFWYVYVETANPANPAYGYTDDFGHYSISAGLPESATTATANTWDFCSPNGLTGTAPIVAGTATIDFQICLDSFPPPPPCGAYIAYANLGGLSYQFTANAYADDSLATFVYAWDFGDGATSTEQNPTHTYAADGVYTVQLTVITANGCEAHACEVICTYNGGHIDTFYYGCQAMFAVGWGGSNPAGGFDPLTLNFYNMSFGVLDTVHWDFGDGTFSTEPDPVHTYDTAGLYTVTLWIKTVDGCESQITMEVYAGDNFSWTEYDCQAMFLPIPDSTSSGFLFLDLSVASTPIQSWQWDFGDNSSSTEQNPYHSYAAPGTYTVSLIISADSCNSMISFELDTNDPFHAFRATGGVLGLAAGATQAGEAPVVDGLKAFPNPAGEHLTLAFSSRKAQDLELRLSSLSGQLLHRETLAANGGANALRVPVQDLMPGMYLLQLRSADRVQTLKFAKQ